MSAVADDEGWLRPRAAPEVALEAALDPYAAAALRGQSAAWSRALPMVVGYLLHPFLSPPRMSARQSVRRQLRFPPYLPLAVFDAVPAISPANATLECAPVSS